MRSPWMNFIIKYLCMQINVTTGNISYVNFKKIYYVIPAILIAISFVVALIFC